MIKKSFFGVKGLYKMGNEFQHNLKEQTRTHSGSTILSRAPELMPESLLPAENKDILPSTIHRLCHLNKQ